MQKKERIYNFIKTTYSIIRGVAMKKVFLSFFYLFLPIVLGALIGLYISNGIDYPELVLPPLAPPKIFFPIVWTLLYLLMGISYFIFKKKEEGFQYENYLYYLQLLVNLLWPIFFFQLKWRFFSIFIILVLDALLIYFLSYIYKKKKISAYINIPYLLWIFFATYLNIGIYFLN